MPKMKTKKGAAKRFRALGSGGFKRAKKGRRHILSNKNRKRKRRLKDVALVHPADAKSVARMLPYA
ncbi:MAG: 50S ribosomal protein L35 [Myxococcales bacterium]|nr:50S ribosomal protein L35 [Myxococcales bacterium]